MKENRPSAHNRQLNVTADRLRLAQLADVRATLNGQSFSEYVWDLIETDLRELPADLDQLKAELQKELRLMDRQQRERLGLCLASGTRYES